MIGVILLAEWLWVTDTERIEGRLDGLGRAVEGKELLSTLDVFSSDFAIRAGDTLVLGKQQIAVAAAAALEEGMIRRLDVREVVITFGSSGDIAVSEVLFNCTVRRGSEGGMPGTVRVKFAWAREDDGVWRITSIADTSNGAFFFEWFGNNKQPLWGYLKSYATRKR